MARAKKQEQHSWQYNTITAICAEEKKDLFLRVKHPVRMEMGLLYSICIDLLNTYHWLPGQVAHFVKFVR